LTSTPRPYEFTFARALPLNATDVRLQVVFRGGLGDEENAVVVATKDISEPTFFAYQNATDYIRIGNEFFTRDDVNNDAGLLARVRPQSLVDYSQTPARLKPASLRSFPLNLDLAFDSQRRTSIKAEELLPGSFIRIAILGEPRLPASAPAQNFIVAEDLVRQCLPNTFQITPMNWQLTYEASLNQLQTHYPEFAKVRDIPGWAFDSCVLNGDESQPGGTDDRATKMARAPYDNPQPFPVLINGGAGF
jgi:hypothetical protein